MADQGAEGLLSPFLRRRRINAARPHLHGRVLDVGCGSGALAEVVPADRYVGVDIDAISLDIARQAHPHHEFATSIADADGQFDTVVSLAVIEHVSDPAGFLRDLASHLRPDPAARVVCTTPRPKADWIHHAGSSIGLFSRHANEEHEELLDREELGTAAAAAGLEVDSYRRFLLGMNQIVVLRRPQ